MSELAPGALYELSRIIYRKAFVAAVKGERARGIGDDLPNGEYTLDELQKMLAAQTDGYADGTEQRKLMKATGEQCTTWVHPGTERTGTRCKLIEGHTGPHKI